MKRINLLILSIVFMTIGFAPMLVYGDMLTTTYTDKEQIVRDLTYWNIAEKELRSSIVESLKDLNNAVKYYQMIPSDSAIYSLKDSDGNLLIPKAQMLSLYNTLKTAIENARQSNIVFVTGASE